MNPATGIEYSCKQYGSQSILKTPLARYRRLLRFLSLIQVKFQEFLKKNDDIDEDALTGSAKSRRVIAFSRMQELSSIIGIDLSHELQVKTMAKSVLCAL